MIQIFTGDDGAARAEALSSSIDSWLGSLKEDPYSREIIFMDDKGADLDPIQKVFEAIGSPSMFAEKKAIVLKNFNVVKAADMELLIPFLEENNIDENGIFIEATSIDARSKAGKKFKTIGELKNFGAPKPWEIPKWIEGEASRQGFKVSSYCAQFMSEFFIADTVVIKSELEKLKIQFPELSELNEKIILDNLSGSNEGNVFELLNLFGLRNRSAFILELEKILTAGTHPLALLTPLYNHVSKLIQIKSMLAQGMGEKDISKEVKMHPFLFKQNKMQMQAGKRPNQVLKKILIRIVDIDVGLKRGQYSYLPDFQMALFEIL